MIQEPLFVALKRTAGCRFRLLVERAFGAGDIRSFKGGSQVLMDDLEGTGKGIIDADLFSRKAMLQDIDLNAFIR